jgi:hypothetical protein
MSAHGDYLTEYREKVSQIRKLKPNADIPPETKGIAALLAVRDMLHKLQNPPEPPPTKNQLDWMQANKLQTELANKVGRCQQRGITLPEIDWEDISGDLDKLRSTDMRVVRTPQPTCRRSRAIDKRSQDSLRPPQLLASVIDPEPVFACPNGDLCGRD